MTVPGRARRPKAPGATAPGVADLRVFVTLVAEKGQELYRDLPWRRTHDPYAILVSEVMLQQTQVPRVVPKYEEWMAAFPTFAALSSAPLEPVLSAWQGLGYNRRAISLKRAAEEVVARWGGEPPADEAALRTLPGVGPATAAALLAFAWECPAIYVETNVRSVVLHELLGDRVDVLDCEVRTLVSAAMDEAIRQHLSPRGWYYALLDYGAYLKRTLPNPSRRSKHHTRQSRFEGSHRQRRAWLLRAVLASPGLLAGEYARDLGVAERSAGREPPTEGEVLAILESLAGEGFLVRDGDRWFVA